MSPLIRRALAVDPTLTIRKVPRTYKGRSYMVDSRINAKVFGNRMSTRKERGWTVEQCCTQPPARGHHKKGDNAWTPMNLSSRVSKDQQAVIDGGKVRKTA